MGYEGEIHSQHLEIFGILLKKCILGNSSQWCSKTTKLHKTTFSRPRPTPLFLKTIKLLPQDHWRSQKFWLGEAQIEKFLWRYIGNVMLITSRKWRHNYILRFDFVIISFKNHYLAKSWNFKSPILKTKRRCGWKALGAGGKRWRWESPQRLAIFKNLLLK